MIGMLETLWGAEEAQLKLLLEAAPVLLFSGICTKLFELVLEDDAATEEITAAAETPREVARGRASTKSCPRIILDLRGEIPTMLFEGSASARG